MTLDQAGRAVAAHPDWRAAADEAAVDVWRRGLLSKVRPPLAESTRHSVESRAESCHRPLRPRTDLTPGSSAGSVAHTTPVTLHDCVDVSPSNKGGWKLR